MTTEDDERRWREAMERLGVDTVRAKLRDAGQGSAAEVRHIVDKQPSPSRGFVEDWLAEKDAADRKHRAKIDLWTLIFAATGAAVGVIGIVVALLHR
jgi:hypothetical protein